MSNKIFTTIPAPKVPRNNFTLSRSNTFSMVFHRCCPTAVQEIIPGDRFIWNSELFARLQPMVAPVYNQMKISQHAFFVPLRTINNHFAEFMFNNRTGDYSEVLPYLRIKNFHDFIVTSTYDAAVKVEVIRLCDYIGLPFKSRSATTAAQMVTNWGTDNAWAASSELRVNLAPFMAYTKIWSEYFRDENLIDDPIESLKSTYSVDLFDKTGDLSTLNSTTIRRIIAAVCRLRPRAWAHDRFTSSLPFTQRGPDVLLPVAGSIPVDWNVPGSETGMAVKADSGDPGSLYADGTSDDYPLSAYADLDNANLSTTINDFRRAERLQRWYENSARGGVRPNEATLAHWGVHTPDATLDRAEFLGGSMQPLVVSEVEQNSATTQTSPQGTLAGKATSYQPGRLFKGYFTEHGFVFVLTSSLVRANYAQGLPKMFSRMQRDEYAWPEFAQLGEEPVFTKEIAAQFSAEDDVFGYTPRYSDYKSAICECHGDFKSSLSFWTQIREFANKPELNSQFIFSDPNLSPFAVQSLFTDLILCTATYNVKASRLLPFYGAPTI